MGTLDIVSDPIVAAGAGLSPSAAAALIAASSDCAALTQRLPNPPTPVAGTPPKPWGDRQELAELPMAAGPVAQSKELRPADKDVGGAVIGVTV